MVQSYVMNKKERIILHRERLYKEVWETPVSQLAPKYGISDVGLTKMCKRMAIPVPPRGYWAKVAYGYKIKKPALPTIKSTDLEHITVNKSGDDLLQLQKTDSLKARCATTIDSVSIDCVMRLMIGKKASASALSSPPCAPLAAIPITTKPSFLPGRKSMPIISTLRWISGLKRSMNRT